MLNTLFQLLQSKFGLGQYSKMEFHVTITTQSKYKHFDIDEEYFKSTPIKNGEILKDEIGKTMLYLWLKSHNDKRYKDWFKYVLIPNDLDGIDVSKISFEELLYFISPQTKITNKEKI